MTVTKDQYENYIKQHGLPVRFDNPQFVRPWDSFTKPQDKHQLVELVRKVCEGLVALGELGANGFFWGAAEHTCRQILKVTSQPQQPASFHSTDRSCTPPNSIGEGSISDLFDNDWSRVYVASVVKCTAECMLDRMREPSHVVGGLYRAARDYDTYCDTIYLKFRAVEYALDYWDRMKLNDQEIPHDLLKNRSQMFSLSPYEPQASPSTVVERASRWR